MKRIAILCTETFALTQSFSTIISLSFYLLLTERKREEERETERKTDRETERQRDRETERE